jgi:cyclase
VTATETIERVADGVWVGIPDFAEGAMGAVVDDGEMLVVDSTSYNVFAERFVATVGEAEGCRGPTFLYITHRHFDHFGGANAIHAPVIGHRLTREAMLRYTPEWLDRNVANWIELDMVIPELVRDPTVVLPQILFDTNLTVQVGETAVEIEHVGGHCSDQTMAYVPRHKVLFASDNLIHGKPPYTGDGDLVTWIDVLRRQQEREIEVVVPGHGPVGGPELLETAIAELEELLAAKLGGDA